MLQNNVTMSPLLYTGADNCTPHGTSEVRHGGHYGDAWQWNERTDRSSSRRVERGEIGVEEEGEGEEEE